MIDIAAIKAQAPGQNATPAQARELMRGELTLRPSGTWSLPAQIAWTEDPFGDRNWRYQLHMLRWLAPLVPSAEAGDDEAAATWLHYASDWIRQNPPGAGKTEAAWANMVDGIRAVQLIQAAPMIADRFPASLPLLEESIADHGAWLADEAHLGHSNHALHQHEGLLMCGLALQNSDWIEIALQRISTLLKSEWDEEGINSEGAIAYHLNNYVWWRRVIHRIEVAGLSQPTGTEVLNETPIALAHATRPDGVFVPIGDTDGGTSARINHPACKYVASKGSDGAPPSELFRVYKDGYIFGRSGWGEFERDLSDETYFAMPFGRFKVHGHSDGGSLNFSSVGVNWVTDPGKYSYTTSDPFRKYVTAHDSHSLIYIEGAERSREAPVPLITLQERDDMWDFTVTDTGYKDVKLSRRVVYSTSGEYLVVLDSVRSDREVTGVQRWQLGEGVDAAHTASNLVSLQSDNVCAALYSSGTKPATSIMQAENPSDLQGRISNGWKRNVIAPVVEFRKSGKSFRFVTVVSAGRKQDPKFRTLGGLPAGVLALSVDNGASHETIVIAGSQVQVLEAQATSDEVREKLEISPKAPTLLSPSKSPSGPQLISQPDRERLLSTLSAARASARNLSEDDRRTLASELEAEYLPLVKGSEFDLGLDACLRDLRMDTTSRPLNLSTTRAPLINWIQDESWRPTYYDVPLWTHQDRWNPVHSLQTKGLHSIDLGFLVLPTFFEPAPGNVLTVMFHGAINRTKSKLPVFQSMARQRSLSVGPILGVSDPTLDLGAQLRLGWYLGVSELDLTLSIADLIRAVAAELKVDHVIVQGNSGGGFAAMQVAAQLPQAHAVVFTPQTDIRRYLPAHAAKAYESVFGQRSEPMSETDRMRLNVADRALETGVLGRSLTFVSNSGDNLHVNEHEVPLLESLAKHQIPTSVHRVRFDLGKGHKSVNNDQYKRVMNEVYDRLA